MLSPEVVWTDIDATQWENLWHFVYAPNRSPRRVIGILEDGKPLALVDSNGPVALNVWPTVDKPLELIADDLRRRLDVDQVILVERPVLTALWDEQQRYLDHEADYDDFVLGIRHLTELALREHAVCSPSELSPGEFPEVPYKALRALVAEAIGSDGAFLITVFDDHELWWSLAGLLRDEKVVRLTSSQGLLEPGHSPEGSWLEAHEQLIEACEQTLGGVGLALGLQLNAFDALMRANDVRAALSTAIQNGLAVMARP